MLDYMCTLQIFVYYYYYIIMTMGTVSIVDVRHHSENDVTMTISGLWKYGDRRHVATGCTALAIITNS